MSYAICEQQRRRSACGPAQSDQHLYCSLPRQNDTSSLYIRNFKILAGLCSQAGQFVSYLVRDSQRHVFSRQGSHVLRNFLTSTWVTIKSLVLQGHVQTDLIKQCRPRSDCALISVYRLQGQSDLGLHYLPFLLHLLDAILFDIKNHTVQILG